MSQIDSQLDETATELFERKPRFESLEEILEALKGIYDER